MSEQDPNVAPEPEEDTDDAVLAATATTDGTGRKMIAMPLDTVIGLRKGAKEARGRAKELESTAAESAAIRKQLDEAAPYINAILTNAQLRAQALAIASGRPAPSVGPTVDQDAIEHAQDMGWYQPDGFTPDSERARRVLNRYDSRSKRTTEDAIRPYAGMTMQAKAQANLGQAFALTDDNDTPLASQESIREVANKIGVELMGSDNPEMLNMVIDQAIGLDRRKGRTPKAREEPLFMDRSGRARNQAPAIDPEQKRRNERLGISDADWTKAGTANERGGRITFEGA